MDSRTPLVKLPVLLSLFMPQGQLEKSFMIQEHSFFTYDCFSCSGNNSANQGIGQACGQVMWQSHFATMLPNSLVFY
jgi:hypothetical protein